MGAVDQSVNLEFMVFGELVIGTASRAVAGDKSRRVVGPGASGRSAGCAASPVNLLLGLGGNSAHPLVFDGPS
jgi:hypothetical protein